MKLEFFESPRYRGTLFFTDSSVFEFNRLIIINPVRAFKAKNYSYLFTFTPFVSDALALDGFKNTVIDDSPFSEPLQQLSDSSISGVQDYLRYLRRRYGLTVGDSVMLDVFSKFKKFLDEPFSNLPDTTFNKLLGEPLYSIAVANLCKEKKTSGMKDDVFEKRLKELEEFIPKSKEVVSGDAKSN